MSQFYVDIYKIEVMCFQVVVVWNWSWCVTPKGGYTGYIDTDYIKPDFEKLISHMFQTSHETNGFQVV